MDQQRFVLSSNLRGKVEPRLGHMTLISLRQWLLAVMTRLVGTYTPGAGFIAATYDVVAGDNPS